MKRLVLYALILALVWIVPSDRVDIARLRPVEVICVYKQGNTVVLATDTEDLGVGMSVSEALEDMRQTSPAVIYLDTAEYLLVAQNAEKEVAALRKELKGSTKLCTFAGRINLKDAAKYLPVHGRLTSLRDWEVGEELPILRTENGRIKLFENFENGA